ncbi:Plant UBX domain-containing protein 2 [Striga hermonthica]|uniref:Plant UBX domain-containing protein 2 n=1 Tax=Striga hermonthica TaxID=68872 RepID=A0A9N7NRP2_STRHE|nr:Plant UBX domain-containing protein 2 [Striga hermonthica]
MDEVRDKMKGLMKKVNKPFSNSTSGKFKGQGRVLGSSSSSSTAHSHPLSSSSSLLNPKPLPAKPSPPPPPPPQKVSDVYQQKSQTRNLEKPPKSESSEKPDNKFDPFSSLITSGKRNPNGYSLQVFECPVCGEAYTSEEEVSVHIESCLSTVNSENETCTKRSDGLENQLETCVSSYISGKPSDGSKEVVFRLLKNVVKEPDNAKFRKIRMGNPKIKEAVGDAPGGIELLECVGFDLREENGEMWLVMDDPCREHLGLVETVISLLDPNSVKELPPVAVKKVEQLLVAPAKVEEETIEPKQVDRQIRVFFSVPESVAAKIELPDSFYNLTAEELKRETDTRKKKLEESKLLIPKSYREKQAKAAKKRYKKTVIRIQFPDGVVLQAIFSPCESTGAIYEFVSNALKDPSLEFNLQHPDLIKRRLIRRFPTSGEKAPTLEDEDLVPTALIKFRPIETDDVVFTGLRNELLEISEPLVSGSAVPSS